MKYKVLLLLIGILLVVNVVSAADTCVQSEENRLTCVGSELRICQTGTGLWDTITGIFSKSYYWQPANGKSMFEDEISCRIECDKFKGNCLYPPFSSSLVTLDKKVLDCTNSGTYACGFQLLKSTNLKIYKCDNNKWQEKAPEGVTNVDLPNAYNTYGQCRQDCQNYYGSSCVTKQFDTSIESQNLNPNSLQTLFPGEFSTGTDSSSVQLISNDVTSKVTSIPKIGDSCDPAKNQYFCDNNVLSICKDTSWFGIFKNYQWGLSDEYYDDGYECRAACTTRTQGFTCLTPLNFLATQSDDKGYSCDSTRNNKYACAINYKGSYLYKCDSSKNSWVRLFNTDTKERAKFDTVDQCRQFCLSNMKDNCLTKLETPASTVPPAPSVITPTEPQNPTNTVPPVSNNPTPTEPTPSTNTVPEPSSTTNTNPSASNPDTTSTSGTAQTTPEDIVTPLTQDVFTIIVYAMDQDNHFIASQDTYSKIITSNDYFKNHKYYIRDSVIDLGLYQDYNKAKSDAKKLQEIDNSFSVSVAQITNAEDLKKFIDPTTQQPSAATNPSTDIATRNSNIKTYVESKKFTLDSISSNELKLTCNGQQVTVTISDSDTEQVIKDKIDHIPSNACTSATTPTTNSPSSQGSTLPADVTYKFGPFVNYYCTSDQYTKQMCVFDIVNKKPYLMICNSKFAGGLWEKDNVNYPDFKTCNDICANAGNLCTTKDNNREIYIGTICDATTKDKETCIDNNINKCDGSSWILGDKKSDELECHAECSKSGNCIYPLTKLVSYDGTFNCDIGNNNKLACATNNKIYQCDGKEWIPKFDDKNNRVGGSDQNSCQATCQSIDNNNCLTKAVELDTDKVTTKIKELNVIIRDYLFTKYSGEPKLNKFFSTIAQATDETNAKNAINNIEDANVKNDVTLIENKKQLAVTDPLSYVAVSTFFNKLAQIKIDDKNVKDSDKLTNMKNSLSYLSQSAGYLGFAKDETAPYGNDALVKTSVLEGDGTAITNSHIQDAYLSSRNVIIKLNEVEIKQNADESYDFDCSKMDLACDRGGSYYSCENNKLKSSGFTFEADKNNPAQMMCLINICNIDTNCIAVNLIPFDKKGFELTDLASTLLDDTLTYLDNAYTIKKDEYKSAITIAYNAEKSYNEKQLTDVKSLVDKNNNDPVLVAIYKVVFAYGQKNQNNPQNNINPNTKTFDNPTITSNTEKDSNGFITFMVAVTPKNDYADPQRSADEFCKLNSYDKADSFESKKDCSTGIRYYFNTQQTKWVKAGENQCMSSITCSKQTANMQQPQSNTVSPAPSPISATGKILSSIMKITGFAVSLPAPPQTNPNPSTPTIPDPKPTTSSSGTSATQNPSSSATNVPADTSTWAKKGIKDVDLPNQKVTTSAKIGDDCTDTNSFACSDKDLLKCEKIGDSSQYVIVEINSPRCDTPKIPQTFIPTPEVKNFVLATIDAVIFSGKANENKLVQTATTDLQDEISKNKDADSVRLQEWIFSARQILNKMEGKPSSLDDGAKNQLKCIEEKPKFGLYLYTDKWKHYKDGSVYETKEACVSDCVDIANKNKDYTCLDKPTATTPPAKPPQTPTPQTKPEPPKKQIDVPNKDQTTNTNNPNTNNGQRIIQPQITPSQTPPSTTPKPPTTTTIPSIPIVPTPSLPQTPFLPPLAGSNGQTATYTDSQSIDRPRVKQPNTYLCDKISKVTITGSVPDLVESNTQITLSGTVEKFSTTCDGIANQCRGTKVFQCQQYADLFTISNIAPNCPADFPKVVDVQGQTQTTNWIGMLSLMGMLGGSNSGSQIQVTDQARFSTPQCQALLAQLNGGQTPVYNNGGTTQIPSTGIVPTGTIPTAPSGSTYSNPNTQQSINPPNTNQQNNNQQNINNQVTSDKALIEKDYNIQIGGDPTQEQLKELSVAMNKLYTNYPDLFKRNRQVNIYSTVEGYRNAIPDAGSSVGITTFPDEVVSINARAFQKGAGGGAWVIAHEFGHIYGYEFGKKDVENNPDPWANQLMGYSGSQFGFHENTGTGYLLEFTGREYFNTSTLITGRITSVQTQQAAACGFTFSSGNQQGLGTLALLMQSTQQQQACYIVCGKEYWTDITNACVAQPQCGADEKVIAQKDCAYGCKETDCGKFQNAQIDITVKNDKGTVVNTYETRTDSNGKYSYTFKTPNVEGQYAVIINVVKNWDSGLPESNTSTITNSSSQTTCNLPLTLVNGLCQCNPPYATINGACQLSSTTCVPPYTLVNGVCTLQNSQICNYPYVLIGGICRLPY